MSYNSSMLTDERIQEIMDLVYKEVEKAIEEGNPPFGAVDRLGRKCNWPSALFTEHI